MFSPKKKKLKLASPHDKPEVKFNGICIFIVPTKIQKVRLEHMKKLARRKGFEVADVISDRVTHMVSEFKTRDDVVECLKRDLADNSLAPSCEILSMQWFISCMEAEDALSVTDEHRLHVKTKDDWAGSTTDVKCDEYRDAKYTCQRSTPVNHLHGKITNALEILEKRAEFSGGEHNSARALAFRKASAAIKAYPKPIVDMRQVENLKDLRGGQHCKQVVQEIIEEDFCSEVEQILNDDWYKAMQIFTGVFGCGAVTARKWFENGCRTLEDVKNHTSISLTKEQKIGIECYADLNIPVRKHEAEMIRDLVYEEAIDILPGTTVTVTGGFSRGKDVGHDVDLLISHPNEGKEEGLLPQLLGRFKNRNMLRYTSTKGNTYSDGIYTPTESRKRGNMDHFARCFAVFVVPNTTSIASQEAHLRENYAGGDENVTLMRTNIVNVLNENNELLLKADYEDQTIERYAEIKVGVKDLQTKANKATDDKNTWKEGDKDTVGKDLLTTDYKMELSEVSSLNDAHKKVLGKQLIGEEMVAAEDNRRSFIPGDACGTIVRRVDLIMVPASQYPYALLGWTGSRMFLRSIRDYSKKEMNMLLTSHGLYNITTKQVLPAENEREIFEHLQLEYKEPCERNC